MSFFNEYTFSVMGIMFEIIGSFVLTIEAFGSKWIEKPLQLFIKFRNWTSSSFIASISLSLILFVPIFAGIFFENNTCAALFIPLLIFHLLFATFFDEVEKFKELASLSFNNKKIGPKGFILILIGNLLQLISTIIQIK